MFPPFVVPSIFKLWSTYVVPVGIESCTFTVVGAVPVLLSNVIVYVITSFNSTFCPDGGFADFVNLRSALFTMFDTWFVELPSTVAWFVKVLLRVSPSNGSTVTSNEIVVFPLAGTSTSIPWVKFVSSYSGFGVSFSFILPVTKLVPSGIVSITFTIFPKSPSFVTVIVYVIFSPSTT